MPQKDESKRDQDEKKSEVEQADHKKRTRETGKHFKGQGTEKHG